MNIEEQLRKHLQFACLKEAWEKKLKRDLSDDEMIQISTMIEDGLAKEFLLAAFVKNGESE